MAAEYGVVPGSVLSEVSSSVVDHEVSVQIPSAIQHTIYDGNSDNVGDPDFQAIAEGLSARRQAESTLVPSRADLFIPPYSISLPLDFKEPPAYFLNAEEWETYTDRLEKINKRMEDQLRGTF